MGHFLSLDLIYFVESLQFALFCPFAHEFNCSVDCGCISCSSPFSDLYLPPSIVVLITHSRISHISRISLGHVCLVVLISSLDLIYFVVHWPFANQFSCSVDCGCISCSSPLSDLYLPPSIVALQSSFTQSHSITHSCDFTDSLTSLLHLSN